MNPAKWIAERIRRRLPAQGVTVNGHDEAIRRIQRRQDQQAARLQALKRERSLIQREEP